MSTTTDLLGPLQPVGRAPGRVWTVLAAAVAAGAVAVGGAGVAVAFAYSGGGLQPEDVLPDSAVAYADLDLDPSAAQKEQLLKLAKRFPSLNKAAGSLDELRGDVLTRLLQDETVTAKDLDWVGDRVGVAATPVDGEIVPLTAVAYTDKAKAKAFLAKEMKQNDTIFYAFSTLGDYVLIADSQEQADAATEPKRLLADKKSFAGAMDKLGGGQVVTAWTDLGELAAALPDGALTGLGGAFGDALPAGYPADRGPRIVPASRARTQAAGGKPSGQVVLGLHATDGAIELTGRSIDITIDGKAPPATLTTGADDLVRDLPASTVAAFGAGGLGPAVDAQLDMLTEMAPELGGLFDSFGIDTGDVAAVLGDATVAAAFNADDVAARSRTKDPDKAQAAVRALLGMFTGESASDLVRNLPDGLAVGSTTEALDAITGKTGDRLGASQGFKAAVPDADGALLIVYVDVAKALELGEVADVPKDAKPVKAVGLTMDNDSFRLRVTLR